MTQIIAGELLFLISAALVSFPEKRVEDDQSIRWLYVIGIVSGIVATELLRETRFLVPTLLGYASISWIAWCYRNRPRLRTIFAPTLVLICSWAWFAFTDWKVIAMLALMAVAVLLLFIRGKKGDVTSQYTYTRADRRE